MQHLGSLSSAQPHLHSGKTRSSILAANLISFPVLVIEQSWHGHAFRPRLERTCGTKSHTLPTGKGTASSSGMPCGGPHRLSPGLGSHGGSISCVVGVARKPALRWEALRKPRAAPQWHLPPAFQKHPPAQPRWPSLRRAGAWWFISRTSGPKQWSTYPRGTCWAVQGSTKSHQ